MDSSSEIASIHAANGRYWDSICHSWQELRDRNQLWQSIPGKPELAFDGEALELIYTYLGDLHQKKVAVIGSGDNYASFGLAGLGADVTSIDISSGQLEVAAFRAGKLGMNMKFIRADAANLEDSIFFTISIPSSAPGKIRSLHLIWRNPIPQPVRLYSRTPGRQLPNSIGASATWSIHCSRVGYNCAVYARPRPRMPVSGLARLT
jgi:SAM-dependent methyltransferase